MAAEFIDEQAPDSGDQLPTDEQAMSTSDLVADLTPVSTTNQQDLQPVDSIDEDLPEKYRGKSIHEIVGMHQEAEKLIGRQGGEVGELRSIVDDYIKANLQATAQQQAAPAPEPVDFFEDPNRAVSQAIETHPTVQRVLQEATQVKQASNLERIKAKHPDMQDVVSSAAFAEYVKASPIRMEIFQRADQNYDFEAADELISSFKERTRAVTQATQVETEARQQQVRAASTGGGSGANTGGSKRVYRRADIRKLMKEDPDRYDQLAPEILQAYREGRVK
jgi:negative regulator of replication initiation